MIQSIQAIELKSLILEKQKFTLIDVREPFEVETGLIEGSINIPLAGIIYNANSLLSEINKDEKIVIYCAHGVRSQSAAMALIQAGFQNVFSLNGGIASWYDAGLED